MLRVICVLALSGAFPLASSAQSIEWSVAPAVLIDFEFFEKAQVGPAIAVGITSVPRGPFSYGLFLTAMRTDFPVNRFEDDGTPAVTGPAAVHRNYVSAAVGIRLMTGGDQSAIGVVLGAGILLEDDVGETDPLLRSSARGESILVPGVELRIPIRASWGVTVFARDQLGGWFNALVDRAEADLSHRFVVGVGVHFR